MAAIEWATPETLEQADLEGVSDAFTDEQILYWLNRAMRAILDEVPAGVLAERIESGAVAETVPADVQVDLVLSKFGNPGGIRTIQESNGPSTGSVTYGGDSPGQLTLTAEHRRKLGIPSHSRRTARTVQTWG